MNLAVLAGQAGSQNAGGSIMTMVILYAVIIGIFWFFAIRPQKKKQKENRGRNGVENKECGKAEDKIKSFFAMDKTGVRL